LLLPVPIEATEYDDHLTVRAEVPGFNEKEIEVSCEPHRLVINGKIEQTDEHKAGETTYTSRRSNEIFHALDLPSEIDPAKATATLKYGVLDIRLPKVTRTEPDHVEVKFE
jgi:HSP20 family protein